LIRRLPGSGRRSGSLPEDAVGFGTRWVAPHARTGRILPNANHPLAETSSGDASIGNGGPPSVLGGLVTYTVKAVKIGYWPCHWS
jgi:hypothetical protein